MKTISSHLHIRLASTISEPGQTQDLLSKAKVWFHLKSESFGLVWLSCPHSLRIVVGLLLEVGLAARRFVWLFSLRVWFQEAK